VAAVFNIYSGRGSSAHRPDLLLKLAIYEHCRGRTKPIQWHRDLTQDNTVRWLTFGLQVGLSTLYRFRDRVAPFLQQWHSQLLHVTVAEGLVDGDRASVDGSTVSANASRRKLANMQSVEQRLEQLEQALSSSEETTAAESSRQQTTDQERPPGWMAATDSGKREQYARYRRVKARLTELCAENNRRRSDKRKPLEKIVVSWADPESVFGLDKLKVYRPLYNVQTISDLTTDFVLAWDVFAQHSDQGTLQLLMNRLLDGGLCIEALLADAGYPVGEDLRFCESVGTTLYAPWQENSGTAKKKSSQPQPVGKDEFPWDPLRGLYVCPEGHDLPFSGQKTRQRANGDTVRFDVYQASPENCTGCPLQGRCTTAPSKGRTVRRDPFEEEIERLKTRMETNEAKELYKKRGQTIERVFADFKEHRNLRRFRGRGIDRAKTQLGLTVLGHNLRTVAKLRQAKQLEFQNPSALPNAA
jgi:transposase